MLKWGFGTLGADPGLLEKDLEHSKGRGRGFGASLSRNLTRNSRETEANRHLGSQRLPCSTVDRLEEQNH